MTEPTPMPVVPVTPEAPRCRECGQPCVSTIDHNAFVIWRCANGECWLSH